MGKFFFYIKITIYFFFYKLKFIFRLFSFISYLYIKLFNKRKLKQFEVFFKKYSENFKKKNNINNKKCIHINFFSWFDYENYLFSYLLLGLIGSKCAKLVFFKSNHLKYIKDSSFIEHTEPLNFFSKISFFNALNITNQVLKKTYQEIFDYKYNDINCGKYSISSSIRVLKTPKINLKITYHYLVVKFFIFKSIILADAAINYLKKNPNIQYAVFNDKSYVGAGELYDECIKNKIKCIQYVASYKNNILLLKKYNENNKDDHPSSISNEIWEKFKHIKLSLNQQNHLNNEIRTQYDDNSWYPSAGTMVGKNIYSVNQLKNKLNLNDKKKVAIIFPHIFWDGTFFFGKDLFKNYVEWYKETLIAANDNRNLNWIIKSHPSNIIKNNREKITNKKIEPELQIIYELFGNIPSHFRFIKSESNISSVNLFNLLDYCFTIRGTVGIESALKNKIVITAGTGRYNNKGFTNNFDKKDIYFQTIKNIHKLENNNDDVKLNAEKFAYISFICKTIQLDFVNFHYVKDKFANLDLEINYNKFNSSLCQKKIEKLHDWLESEDSDYFEDDCNEWNIK